MKKRTMTVLTALMLSLVLCIGFMTGCGNGDAEAQADEMTGIIRVKVNPDIAVTYDRNGNVLKVEGINDDGRELIADYNGYEGKPCDQVIRELVEKMDMAGYFVEEIEGEGNKIVLEIENGSYLPSDDFLNTIVEDLQHYTVDNHVNAPVDVQGISNYGWTNYGDTDYGPENDGITDYEGASKYDSGKQTSSSQVSSSQQTKPAQQTSKPQQSQPSADYGNTHYGNTNYDDDGTTNYGGNTNYDDDGTTNYGGNTNYDDGGTTNYGGNTNYDDGGTTNYGGNTNYDDGGDTNYGSSDYDDDDED
ncbi:MAG: hypothetical protein UIJ88_01675 [Anaerovoracaceae bacterium]|nr:hypothetical protein [Anaerovoracaceae bacterium]